MSKTYWALALLILATVLLVPWLGSETLVIDDVFNPGTLGHRIFWDLRLPRLFITLTLGGVLANVGGIYQSLFKNPICDPYILGVSSAVLVGLAIGETFFNCPIGTLMSFAWGVGAALSLVFILVLFSMNRKSSPERIVLFGIGANFLLSSILFVILSVKNQSMGGGSLKWFFGFLPWMNLQQGVFFFGAGIFVVGAFTAFGRLLDVLRLGDSVAKTLSIRPIVARNTLLLITSLIVGISVTLSGTIGFVGLVIPQICRLVCKPKTMRQFMPLSFFMGAAFLSISDALSRCLIPPFEFPVGVMTTLLGGPLFLLLLWRRPQ